MYCAHMRGGHKAGNIEAELCGVTISVMMCAETMVVGVLGGGTPPRGCQHHAAEIRESKGLIKKWKKSHLPVVGSRIRHQISTSHMCFRADGHISVSERPQTRDFHRNRHPKMPIFGACGAQNRHPTGARRRCRPQPTPKFPVKIPMTILPYTKFRDPTRAVGTTRRGGVPAPRGGNGLGRCCCCIH